MKRILKVISLGFLLYLSYTFIFGILIFNLPLVNETDLTYDHKPMLQSTNEPTQAYILDDLKMALDARLALINNAEETINISYYTIHGGISRDLFFGALLEKADEGVKVNIIIDYIFYYQTRDAGIYYDALAAHENIHFKLYEPYRVLKPYTIQNRLHDKLIMVDDTYGIIGGRNIGDRYYDVGVDTGNKTYDLDVLVFGDSPHSTIIEMNDYYKELFTHPYSQSINKTYDDELLSVARNMKDSFKSYKSVHSMSDTLQTIYNDAITVDNASFIRSPLTRLHKYPVVLETLSDIAMEYDDWFVMSPYIIFSSLMTETMPAPEHKNITVFTNNPALSNNLFAMSGYNRYKPDIAKIATLYEFNGSHSIHGKGMVFGDEVSVIGSLNLDPRSTTLSTESVMVLYGEAFTESFNHIIDDFLDQSLIIDSDGVPIEDTNVDLVEMDFFRRQSLRIVGLFSYFFDSML